MEGERGNGAFHFILFYFKIILDFYDAEWWCTVCIGILSAAVGWSAAIIYCPHARCKAALCNIRCSTKTKLSWPSCQHVCTSTVTCIGITHFASVDMATAVYAATDAFVEPASVACQLHVNSIFVFVNRIAFISAVSKFFSVLQFSRIRCLLKLKSLVKIGTICVYYWGFCHSKHLQLITDY